MEKIKSQIELVNHYNYLLRLISWDMETEMPVMAQAQTANAVSFVASKQYEAMTDPDFVKALEQHEKDTNCTPVEQKMIAELLYDMRKMKTIPKDEYVSFQKLLNEAHPIWVDAKEKADFSLFAPTLKEIISFQKKIIGYYGYEGHPYNALLNEYERGMTVERLDALFTLLKERLLPLLRRIQKEAVQIEKVYTSEAHFDVQKQKEFSRFVAEYVGFDYKRGVLKESAHPFSMSIDKNNIRMTSHYHATLLESSILSTLHETGHSLYEMGVADELVGTLLDSGTSLGIHESQSRFYENIVGKDIRFWVPIYSRLQDLFPEELANVSCGDFVQMLNRVEADDIRVEADELTYPFHVMIRYEIEKMLFEDKIEVDELPRVWNQLYKEYLGIDVPNDARGVLQDVHWSMGSFGYFPTYVLGSLYASQMAHTMEEVIDFDVALGSELSQIRHYLEQYVHRHGKMKSSDEIMLEMTGEAFNPEYYITYLHEKFSKVYGLK